MNTRDPKFQLIVYEGDFSLPSLDIDSTRSILYATIAKLPVQVRILESAKLCTFYGAPCFVHKNLRFRTFKEIFSYLKTLNYNIDANLNLKQWSESIAWSCYVESKLRPHLAFLYWLDTRNREEFTNIWYMKSLPFPFNFHYTRCLREKAMSLIEVLYPTTTQNAAIKEFTNRAAMECLSSLSTKLGTCEYFFGNSPTSLDVLVYSLVAPLIKLPFPLNELSNIPSLWPNLANFVKRIDAAYFPNLPKKSKYIKQEDKTSTGDDDVSYVAILILTVSATTLLLGFAFSRGFISNKIY